jgi:hypothetical protein
MTMEGPSGTRRAWAAWALCVLLVAAEASAGIWFRQRARGDVSETYPDVLRWIPSGDRLAWRELPVHPSQVVGLNFDRGRRFRVETDSGATSGTMEILYLDFDGGHSQYHYDLLSHPPQYCLGMAGWEVLRVHPDRTISVDGEPMRIQSLAVRSPSGTVSHVFKGIWIHSRFGFNGTFTREARVRLALNPMPAPPACIFIVAVSGVEDDAAAYDAFLGQGVAGFRRIEGPGRGR